MSNTKTIFIPLLTLTTLSSVCLNQANLVVALPANNDHLIHSANLDFSRQVWIVGGQEAIKNEFTGLVNIRITRNGGDFLCAGNIISSSWVLTAGHCIWPLDEVSAISITAGDHYRDETEATEQNRIWKRIIVPGSFNRTTLASDIALVELEIPFTFNEFVQPTILANPRYVSTGEAVIAGWGRPSNSGLSTNELRTANVNFVSNSVCGRHFAVEIIPSMVCASARNRGICIGDSGGPLLAKSKVTNLPFLAGIASFVDTNGCGDDWIPDVFTRVTSHVGWIQSHVDNVQIDPGLPPTTTTKRTTTLRTTTTTEKTTTLRTTTTPTTTTSTDKPSGKNGVERTSTNLRAQMLMFVVFLYRIVIAQFVELRF